METPQQGGEWEAITTPTNAFYFKWISIAAHTLDNFALDYKSGEFLSILLAYGPSVHIHGLKQ